MQPNIVLKKRCPFDGTILIYDTDGSASGSGIECWYCPKYDPTDYISPV